MTINAETVLVRTPELVAADMDGDVVMMSVERGQYFGLGGVGVRIWKLLERPIAAREIARIVASEYDVDADVCLADVLAFVRDLVENGIAEAA